MITSALDGAVNVPVYTWYFHSHWQQKQHQLLEW